MLTQCLCFSNSLWGLELARGGQSEIRQLLSPNDQRLYASLHLCEYYSAINSCQYIGKTLIILTQYLCFSDSLWGLELARGGQS